MDFGFQIDFLRIGFLNKVSSSGPTGFNRIWIGFSELELVSSGQFRFFRIDRSFLRIRLLVSQNRTRVFRIGLVAQRVRKKEVD